MAKSTDVTQIVEKSKHAGKHQEPVTGSGKPGEEGKSDFQRCHIFKIASIQQQQKSQAVRRNKKLWLYTEGKKIYIYIETVHEAA